jgi:serine/threonine protein kinase
MRCALCNEDNREAARFCNNCGAALDATIARTIDDPLLDAIRTAFSESYYVESLLGRGGMGHVYKARERSLERYVAIKVIPQERNRDAAFVERFRREAKIAARLRHPRIVSVHEVGTLGGFHYFSMDFIEGSTLRSVVQRQRWLPVEDAIGIVTEIGRAVAHAHGRGVIHRDLKPENVMIDSEGDVFVMDFGLARAIEDQALTHSGAIVGSPTYMSPEQLAGGPLDERTDIYAIGLLLFYCLTGEDLFAADSIPAVVAKHLTVNAAEVINAHPAIPPHLRGVLIAALEENRDRRTRTAKELLDQLTQRKGLAAQHELPTLEMDKPVVETPPPKADSDPANAKRKARLKSLLDEM